MSGVEFPVSTNVHTYEKLGFTWLMDSAQNGNLGYVKYCIAQNADLNLQSSSSFMTGATALQIAIWTYGCEQHHVIHYKIAEILLAAGADPNIQDDKGKTALHEAANTRRPDMVSLLLANKADVFIQDKNGHTALMLAVNCGDYESSKALLEAKSDLNALDNHGQTALDYATMRENADIIKLLQHSRTDASQRPSAVRSDTRLLQANA